MAIFTAVATVIAAGLGIGAIGTSVIAGALAFGASLAYSYITRKKTRSYSATAVQGEVQIGGEVPIGAAYGTIKTKGHRLYYAKYGSGNKWNADVFALSNGWCSGLENYIYFYGKKWTLTSVTPSGGCDEEWTISGWEDILKIRVFHGSPTQVVDSTLVAATSSLGQDWKSTSTLKGVCYVTILRKYDSDKWDQGRPSFDFILNGLKLYDWRLDSTVAGGSGSHRIDDSSTWEFTKNPAVQRLNYQLGLQGISSGRPILGEAKQFSELSLTLYTASANTCDIQRTKGARTFDLYQCNLYVLSTDNHSEVLKEFDDAMAGYAMNPFGLAGVLAGASQTSVLTITDDDIRANEPIPVRKQRPGKDSFNHLSGQFTSIDAHWSSEALTPVTVSADVTADKYIRTATNDFLQVTDQDVAQYLLTIRYRQNRLGGTATLPISRRVAFKVQVGDWVTYDSTVYLITRQIWENDLQCTLQLSETSSDVYSETGIDAGPVVVEPSSPTNPSLLSNVATFTVAAGFLAGADGNQVPTLVFGWDAPDDETITHVVIEYRKNGTTEPVYVAQSASPESGEHIVTDNVVAGIQYDARCTIITVPDRLKTFSSWITTATVTPNFQMILADMAEDNRQTLIQFREDIDALKVNVPLGFADSIAATADAITKRTTMRQVDGANEAAVIQEAVARATADSALASLVALVTARSDGTAAEGLFKIEAVTAPAGVDVRLALYGRITTAGGAYEEAGLWIDLTDEGGGAVSSKIVLLADQTSIQDSGGDIIAVFDSDGIILNAVIPEITADNIAAGTITADEIVVNGLTNQVSVFVADNERVNTTSTGWVDLDDLEVDVVVGRSDTKVLIHTTSVLTNTANQIDLRIVIDGNWYPYGIKGSEGDANSSARIGQASINCIWEPRDDISLSQNAAANDRLWEASCWSADLGMFCAVGKTLATTTNIMTSTNGTSWTARSHTSGYWFWDVVWCPDISLFIAMGNAWVHTSPDGVTWTLRTGAGTNLRRIAWSDTESIAVAVGTGGEIRTSTDGITWTTRTSPYSVTWRAICWSDDDSQFVALAQDGGTGRCMTSPDGITWTGRTDAVALAGVWWDVAYSPDLGLYCAVGETSDKEVMTSPDGITWTNRPVPRFDYSSGDNEFINIAWGDDPGLFVATSSGDTFNHGQVMTSDDGIDWREVASTSDEKWVGVSYSPSLNKFVMISNDDDKTMVSTTVPAIGTHTIKTQWGVSDSTGSAYSRSLSTIQFLR